MYQIEASRPGSTVRYCGQSNYDDTTLQDLRVTMSIDFPPTVDIDAEIQALEKQA
jgi:hypothetical protein